MTTETHLPRIPDRLRLEGLTLAAVESGRIRMDAGDYLEIARSAAAELKLFSTIELRVIALRLPPALLSLVENILFDRLAVERRLLTPRFRERRGAAHFGQMTGLARHKA